MRQTHQNNDRTIELAKTAGTEQDIALIQQHLKEVVEGAAFRASHRSGQFLKYVVEQAIAGHFEALKERVIGVELFGRSPSYDTGDDAIVRVTASDVRKRLLQHYERGGASSEFRISLPPGSYIPEIARDIAPAPAEAPHSVAEQEMALGAADLSLVPVPAEIKPVEIKPAAIGEDSPRRRSRRWMVMFLIATVINLVLWGIFWYRYNRKSNPAASILPWSVLFDSPRALQIITSDPDIAEIQGLTGQPISVSDYANHNYIPDPTKLTADMKQQAAILLRGNKASLVDAPIAVNIAELGRSSARKITLHPARSIQLANLQTDDNFVLLGSPRSNPWSAFFADQLKFRFAFDKDSGQEIIRNIDPGPHEQAEYVPTALGWATGQSYAIIALVRNPDQNGQVLLLAGANAEGTEAAGKLVTDLPRLSAALKTCGMSPSGPLQHFELLLRLNMMAGSPTKFDIQACQVLPGSSLH